MNNSLLIIEITSRKITLIKVSSSFSVQLQVATPLRQAYRFVKRYILAKNDSRLPHSMTGGQGKALQSEYLLFFYIANGSKERYLDGSQMK